MSTKPQQEPYDAYAAGYARCLDPTLAGAVERLVDLAGAGRGMDVLDLATGTGVAARAAARRGASVVAVDRSPGMLAVARELAPGLNLQGADAGALPFEDAVFDSVICGLALSHFSEREEALREVLRVLRAGGRFVASTWGEGGSFPCGPVGELIDRYVAEAPAAPLDEATWISPGRGSAVLRRAGFADVSVRTETFTGDFADANDAIAWCLAWPRTAMRLARLDTSQRDRLLREARRALVHAADLSWRFAFNFYVAIKPGAT